MDTLFGTEFSLPMKFFIAFAVVLLLIGAVTYLVRRFGAGGLAVSGQRNRQPRLAVVDSTAIDTRRKLVIVRRDNVEHLLLIGGPTDVLVEPNIVRAAPAQSARDLASLRIPTPMHEPAPLPIAPLDSDDWEPEPPPPRQEPVRAEPVRAEPVRAEPARVEPVRAEPRIEPVRAEHAPRAEVRADSPMRAEAAPRAEPTPRQEPAPRHAPAHRAEPVIHLEPAARATAQAVPAMPSFTPPPPPVFTPSAAAAPHQAPAGAAPRAPESTHDHLAGLAASLQQATEPPAPEPVVAVQPAPQQPRAAAAASPDEQNLADMAHRLEAALRRPAAGGARPAPPAPAAAQRARPAAAPTAMPPPAAVPPPPAAATRPPAASYESLQREMASLLGRQSGSS